LRRWAAQRQLSSHGRCCLSWRPGGYFPWQEDPGPDPALVRALGMPQRAYPGRLAARPCRNKQGGRWPLVSTDSRWSERSLGRTTRKSRPTGRRISFPYFPRIPGITNLTMILCDALARAVDPGQGGSGRCPRVARRSDFRLRRFTGAGELHWVPCLLDPTYRSPSNERR
jgi:hypothetical protein